MLNAIRLSKVLASKIFTAEKNKVVRDNYSGKANKRVKIFS